VKKNAGGYEHGTIEKIHRESVFVGVHTIPTISYVRYFPEYAGTMQLPHHFF
jgi:hypothetical protein